MSGFACICEQLLYVPPFLSPSLHSPIPSLLSLFRLFPLSLSPLSLSLSQNATGVFSPEESFEDHESELADSLIAHLRYLMHACTCTYYGVCTCTKCY